MNLSFSPYNYEFHNDPYPVYAWLRAQVPVYRDTSKLISFGSGRHFCLGAPLGRLEARVALELLVARVRPGYEIDPDGISRVHSVNVRGFASLPTAVTPR